jgi:integrase
MIFKREGSDYYWYRFMYKGERYCASTRQGNAKAAKEIESAKRTALAKAEEGIYERTPAPTLEDFCTKHFEPRISATAGGSITGKTWDDFYMVGIRALKSYKPLASCPLDEIDEELIGKFKVHRRSEGKKGKAVSTVNASLRVLRRILNKAIEWHAPKKGVFFLDRAPNFDTMKGENKREYVVSSADEKKYLVKADSVSRLLADVVTVLLDTAMRPEECNRMRWEYVSWDGGLHGVFQVVRGKTDHSRRELPMSGRVRAILRTRWENASRPAEGWIFPAPTKSGHMEPSTIKKPHAKALKESKIARFLPYDLRHTSLTRLACECREPWTVARIAGHGDIKIGQRYVHSHRMERSAWWAEWWAYVSAGRRVGEVATPLATEEKGHLEDAIQ